MHRYRLCGLLVASDLEMPELDDWRGPIDGAPDIVFQIGPIEDIPSPAFKSDKVQANGEIYILSIDRVGRVRVAGGRSIMMDPAPGADPERVRLNLIGTIQAVLWHQRGLTPIHAGAVAHQGRAVLLAGPSRSGKSVLCAALQREGCPLLADDFAIVAADETPPVLWPGYQKLRLWDDACHAFGLIDRRIARAHPVYEKFVVAPPLPSPTAAMEVSDLVFLNDLRGSAFNLEPFASGHAMRRLLQVVHFPAAVRAMGLQDRLFQEAASIVLRVRTWRLSIPDDLTSASTTARRLLEALAAKTVV